MMNVVIVGASLAGLRTVESLRHAGFQGGITLIGDEPYLPYDRPPLSKAMLSGDLDVADIGLCERATLDFLGVDLCLDSEATSLDPSNRTLHVGGRAVTYDELVVATGARARRLPQFDGMSGVHVLRTADDALGLRRCLDSATGVVVVGAGFVGAEVASAARDRGLPTTVLEAFTSPLGRAVGPEIGHRLGRLHAECGVVLRCGVAVDGPIVRDGRVEGVRLRDGTSVLGDVVVIGVGSVANTEWLAGSGLDLTDGVSCDVRGRAVGADHVHAVGDVARWPSALFGDAVRTEHWTSAGEQAQIVAADLLGHALPLEAVPFVWSDQFGRRIQIAGRCGPGDDVHVVRDDADVFVAITGRNGRLVSVIAVDDPRSVGRFRRLIAAGATWDDARAHAETR